MIVPDRGVLREWVDLYGPQTEARDEAHLGAAIALLSAAIGWKAWIKWGENAEPCTVNVMLEGQSATARKTTVANGAQTLARLAMDDLDEPGLSVRSIGHASGRGLYEAVATTDAALAKKWETEPPPGTLLVWDEFGYVLGDPKDIKGSDWRGQTRTAIMALTNGRHSGAQTGGQKLEPSRCAVAILATMTRRELEDRVSLGLLRDGFMGRFALIPFAGRARLLAAPPRRTHHHDRARTKLVGWLRTLAQTRKVIGDVFDAMTPAGAAAREDWYRQNVTELEAQAEQDGTEGSRAAVEAFGRLQTTALKLAAVAGVSEWDAATDLSKLRIDARHVQWGQHLAEIALREVIDLGKEGGLRPEDAYAERLKEYLEKKGPQSKKQVLDGLRMADLTRGQRWKVVAGLVGDDLIQWTERTSGRWRTMVGLLDDPDALSAANVSESARNGRPHPLV